MLHPTKGENGEIQDIELMDGVFHFIVISWKLLFAFIPPTHMMGGIPTFVIAIAFIGMITKVVGEFADLFGCVLGIPPGITAITLVALGTSLPDTFASVQAAQGEKYADSAIGNVTGSNSVNVFLGLGLPWVVALIATGKPYYVPADALGFSVVVFVVCAVTCIVTLVVRRQVVKGELGGSN
jgi:solute carrier family 8 (sodium/calcium exchanger)